MTTRDAANWEALVSISTTAWFMDEILFLNRGVCLFYKAGTKQGDGIFIEVDADGGVRSGFYEDSRPYITDGGFRTTGTRTYESQAFAVYDLVSAFGVSMRRASTLWRSMQPGAEVLGSAS
jgi:hypothetical protein